MHTKVAARRGEEAAADEEEEQEERKVCATDATGHNKHIGISISLVRSCRSH